MKPKVNSNLQFVVGGVYEDLTPSLLLCLKIIPEDDVIIFKDLHRDEVNEEPLSDALDFLRDNDYTFKYKVEIKWVEKP